MRYCRMLLVLLLGAFLFLGCSGPQVKETSTVPAWVEKSSGAFPGEVDTVIIGVGVIDTNAVPNISVQRQTVDHRARAEVAKVLKTTVANMIKDYMDQHKDYFDVENTAGSDEFIEIITKSVTDATLINCQIVDHYRDKENNAYYALARMDLNSSIYDEYKNSMKKVLREQHRVIVKERAEDALKDLDKEVEKQREREKEILGLPTE